MNKPIYRTKENKILLGLCSGLEQSMGISRYATRSLFLFLTMVGGSGIVFYLLFSFLVQKKDKISSCRFLGVFYFFGTKFNLEFTRLRLFGGLFLIALAHYGLIIYFLAFLWMKLEKLYSNKKEPNDNNLD